MTADTFGTKPFGIRDIKLTNMDGDEQVDLPNERQLSFNEVLVSGELRGGGMTVAIATELDKVEASLEAGGISLEAYALMTGRTAVESGSTPNKIKTLTGAGADRYPYFKIYGKSLGDGDDDIHVKLRKCKLTGGIQGTLQDGEFFVTQCNVVCIDDGTAIYDIVENETATELPQT